MDSLEANKVIAAVLVAGIAFFVTGTIADNLIVQERLEKPAIKIEGVPAAATTSQPKQVELPPLAPLLAKADPKSGEAFAQKVCAACHTFNKGGKPGVGPNLYGIVGDPHAHEKGFDYSNAIKSKKGPWTYAELNEWLHKPSSYAPGTRMPFAGIPQAQLRADVIAYLKTISPEAPPFPKPEAAQPAKNEVPPAAGNGKAEPAKAAAPAGKAEPAKPAAPAAPAASGGPAAPAAPAAAAAAPGAPAPAAPAPQK